MPNILILAAEVGGAMTGLGSLIGAAALTVRTKADIKAALRKLEIDNAAATAAGLASDRVHELAVSDSEYAQMKGLYEETCKERDRLERLCREHRTEAEVLRSMWGAYDLSLDDVVEIVRDHNRRQKRRE
jgi:hypothetical protein